MQYLYHRVPDNMQGTIIYPGNILVKKEPGMVHVMEKYKGRKRLVQSVIPGLNCLWNDVVFLSATHPKKVMEALVSAGGQRKRFKYFCIDPKMLARENTRIYFCKPVGVCEENFEAYNPENLGEYDYIPDETIAYYREQFDAGKHPLMFYRIPHIVYRGTIETKGLEIIEV